MLPANMILVTLCELFCPSPFDNLIFGIDVLFRLQIRKLVVSCYSRSYCPSYLGGSPFFFHVFVLLIASRGL